MLCLPLCLINWTTSHALCSADEQAPSCVSAPQSSLLTFASYMAFGPTNLTPAPSSISRFVSIFADVQTSRRAKSSLQGKAAQSNSYLRIGNPNRLTNLPCQSFSTHTRTCQARLRVPHAAHVVYSYVLALSTLACTTVAHCAHCWHGPFQDMCLALAFQGLPILKLVILGSTVRTWYRRCVPYIRDSPWHLHMVSRLTGVPWLLIQALSLQCPATKDLPAHETLIEGSRSLPRKTSAFRLQG